MRQPVQRGLPESGRSGLTVRQSLRDAAKSLATRFQDRYRFMLNVIFMTTAAATLVLAWADAEPPRYWFVLVYFVGIMVALRVHRTAEKRRLKDRSIEYRAFEIGLSIQHIWDLMGLRRSVSDHYLRLQRSDVTWVRQALRTAEYVHSESPDPTRGIAAVYDFVRNQREFFCTRAAPICACIAGSTR